MTVNQTRYVGFGLAGHQVRRAELLQNAVVLVFIDLPLVIDPTEATRRTSEKQRESFQRPWRRRRRLPHILIPPPNSKVVRLCRVDKNGVKSHFLLSFLHNHQFTATQTHRRRAAQDGAHHRTHAQTDTKFGVQHRSCTTNVQARTWRDGRGGGRSRTPRRPPRQTGRSMASPAPGPARDRHGSQTGSEGPPQQVMLS